MKFCSKPFNQAYVFPNGDVRACGWTYQCIGNLLEQSMEEIWNSSDAEKIRDAVRDGSYALCNKVVCPYLNNDTLPDLDDAAFKEATVATHLPIEFDAAYDYICNHSCPSCRHEIFCPTEEYRKNMDIITDKLIPIMDESKYISTDGNGDVFASPYIMRMLRELNPKDRDFKLSLQTNGVLCDEKKWGELSHLFDYNLGITVTPNSFVRGTYKYLSGGHDNLDKMIDNLYYMKKLRQENKLKRFDISIVVQDANYRELPEFVKRCIEDFQCDRVTIKPIFYWFALTPEEYWFKDILNPKHPYFNEYMEILKDPILKHPKVFFWGGDEIHKAQEHPATQYKRYFDVFSNILKKENPSKALEEELLKKCDGNVAIYGTNDMAQMMYNLLKNTSINVIGFIDRDAKVNEFCGMPVTKFDTYEPDMVDTILVSNFQYITNVTRDLRFLNFNGEIISFEDIIE